MPGMGMSSVGRLKPYLIPMCPKGEESRNIHGWGGETRRVNWPWEGEEGRGKGEEGKFSTAQRIFLVALGSGGEKVSEDELSVRTTKNFDYVLAARADSNVLYKIALKVVIAFRTVIRSIQLPLASKG